MLFLSRRWFANGIASFIIIVFVLAVTCAALAQSEFGNIDGKVTDPNGALVPNASITIKSVDTGTTQIATSSADGTYRLANLKPGLYELTVASSGFAASTQRVQVTVGSNTPVETKLGLTTGEANVTVIAEGGITVNTQTQEVSNVVSQTQLRELPSLTRNPYDFVQLSGSVASDQGNSTYRGVGVAINGQRATSTNILLDGGENVDSFRAVVGQTVPLDAVQEYRVITNNFSAQYGRATGGVVDVVTKSGSNSFHGTGYEFNRISRFASNGFANNALNIPRANFTRNQFGYSVGGRIIKDKLFFFSSTEWTRVRSVQGLPFVVPTLDLIAASSPRTQAFFNAFPFASGLTRGTTFPVSAVCPTGPSKAGLPGCGAFTNLGPNFPAFQLATAATPTDVGAGVPQNSYQSVGRVDYNLSSRTSLYGRFAYYHEFDFPGTVTASPYAGFNTGQRLRNQNYIVSLNHNFTSNFISTTKFIFNRLFNIQPLGTQPVGPTLYITQVASGQFLPGTNGIAAAFPGYTPTNPGNAIPFGGPQNTGQIVEDVSYSRGKNLMTFGGSVIYIQDNRAFGAYEEAVEALGPKSSDTFNKNTGALTQSGALSNFVQGQLFAFAAAVFPQGQLPGGVLTLPVGPPNFTRSNRYKDFSVYYNDAIKYTPRLTVNLGLRYEYYGVQHNKNPNLDSNFFFGPGSTIQQKIANGQLATTPNSPVGGLYAPDKDNFGPHIGLAWDVFGNGKTSMRAGYSRAFERNFGNVTFNVIQNPPNYAVIALQIGDPGFTAANSLPITLSNSGPLAGAGGTKILPGTSLRYLRQDLDVAYADLFTMSVEHEISPGTVVSLTYNGSRGSKLYSIENLNRRGFGNLYLGVPLNPAAPARLNTQYTSVNGRGNGGFSRYNGIVAAIESSNLKKLHLNGLQFTARYTYSVARDNLSSTFSTESGNNANLGLLNPFDPGLDYGYANFDVRNRFVGGFTWQIPYSRSGLARHFLGGWTLSGIFQARSGLPFSLYDCTFQSLVCFRAELNGPVQNTGSKNPAADPNQANVFNYLDYSGLNAGASSGFTGTDETGPYPLDMSKRNAFRGPGFWNVDGGIYKNFHITERYTLQFRSEFYNVFNHANLYVNGGTQDISLGQKFVQACRGCATNINPNSIVVATDRRNIQFALKLIF